MAKNLIVDSGGKRVVLTGVSDYLVPFYTSDDGKPDPHLADAVSTDFERRAADFAAMRKAGYNTVRVPLGVDVYLNNVYYGGGTAEYLHRLQQIVASAQAARPLRHLRLVGAARRAADDRATATGARHDAGRRPSSFAWSADVLFEPVNEPNNIDWADWQTAMTTIVDLVAHDHRLPRPADRRHHQLFVGLRRRTRPRRCRALDAGLLGGDSQVVFANHRYANANTCFCDDELNGWQSAVGEYVEHVPDPRYRIRLVQQPGRSAAQLELPTVQLLGQQGGPGRVQRRARVRLALGRSELDDDRYISVGCERDQLRPRLRIGAVTG